MDQDPRLITVARSLISLPSICTSRRHSLGSRQHELGLGFILEFSQISDNQRRRKLQALWDGSSFQYLVESNTSIRSWNLQLPCQSAR
jgi:hypothetical protein